MKNNKTLGVSIVIPCYNEENNLKRGVLDQVNSYLQTVTYSWEVIICNDCSTDNSFAIAKEFTKLHRGFSVLDLPKGGKPGAIWGGIQHAKQNLILFTDMDQSTPLQESDKLLPYYSKGYDIVIGSRGGGREGNSPIRKLGAKVFSFTRNLLLNSKISDTQCGFKSMKRSIALEIFPHLQVIKNIQNGAGWRVSAFDVELLFIANKLGYKIKEVVVQWKNEDTSTTKGDANTRYVKESKQMAKEVIRVKINDIKGVYNQIKN